MNDLNQHLFAVTWSGLPGRPAGRATFANHPAAERFATDMATEYPTVNMYEATIAWTEIGKDGK